jgi:hypothetical protein
MRAGASLSLISWCDRMLTIARASGSSEVGTLGVRPDHCSTNPLFESLFFPASSLAPITHARASSFETDAVVDSASSGATDSGWKKEERKECEKWSNCDCCARTAWLLLDKAPHRSPFAGTANRVRPWPHRHPPVSRWMPTGSAEGEPESVENSQFESSRRRGSEGLVT